MDSRAHNYKKRIKIKTALRNILKLYLINDQRNQIISCKITKRIRKRDLTLLIKQKKVNDLGFGDIIDAETTLVAGRSKKLTEKKTINKKRETCGCFRKSFLWRLVLRNVRKGSKFVSGKRGRRK